MVTDRRLELGTVLLEIVSDRVPTLNKLRVLDLACRTGAITRAFAQMGSEVIGIQGDYDTWSQIPQFPGARYVLDEIENAAEQGYHNVTICTGIIERLSIRETLKLLKIIRHVTVGFAVIDNISGYPTSDMCELTGWEETERFPDYRLMVIS